MTARKTPQICRAIERALLARDRLELAAADRLLRAVGPATRRPRRPGARTRKHAR